MKLLYVDAAPVVRIDDDDPFELWDEFRHLYRYSTWIYDSKRLARIESEMVEDGLAGTTFTDKFIDWLHKRGIKTEAVK